jgi:hypothetical protein
MIQWLNLETIELLKNVVAILLAYLVITGVAGAFQAWVAYKAGDDTAYQFGLTTINPFAHIDPMTLWLMPLGYVVFHVVIGLGQPIPIIWDNFTRPWRKLKLACVALAQPMAIFMILAVMIAVQVGLVMLLLHFGAGSVLPVEIRVYSYILRALMWFAVWFLPYQVLMSCAQIFVYERGLQGMWATVLILLVPLFGAVFLMDASQLLLIKLLTYIALGIGAIVPIPVMLL